VIGIVTKTYGRGDTEFAPLGYVEPAALEAKRHEMKLGLRHSCPQAQEEAVVEIACIVAAILVDDEGMGQRAELHEAVPVGAGSAEAGSFEGKDRADLSMHTSAIKVLKSSRPVI
jgi:hypothetical protein